MEHSDRFRRSAIFFLCLAIGLFALAPQFRASGRSAVLQITDARTDRLGEVAVDDVGEVVEAITTADPFGANRRHEFQIVRWAGPGLGRPSTRFGGMGESISVSDEGRLTAFISA